MPATGFYTGIGLGAIRGQIKLIGFDKLEKALRELPKEIATKIMRKALRDGAKIVQTSARQKIHNVSGILSKSITISIKKGTPGKPFNLWISASRKKGGFYAHIVEYGTYLHPSGYWIKAKKGKALLITGAGKLIYKVWHPGIKPHPFMRPAFFQNRERIIDKIKTVLTDGILKNFKKLGIEKTI